MILLQMKEKYDIAYSNIYKYLYNQSIDLILLLSEYFLFLLKQGSVFKLTLCFFVISDEIWKYSNLSIIISRVIETGF